MSLVKTTARLSERGYHFVTSVSTHTHVSLADVLRGMVTFAEDNLDDFVSHFRPSAHSVARKVADDVARYDQQLDSDSDRESGLDADVIERYRADLSSLSRDLQVFAHEAQTNRLTSVAMKAMVLSDKAKGLADKIR